MRKLYSCWISKPIHKVQACRLKKRAPSSRTFGQSRAAGLACTQATTLRNCSDRTKIRFSQIAGFGSRSMERHLWSLRIGTRGRCGSTPMEPRVPLRTKCPESDDAIGTSLSETKLHFECFGRLRRLCKPDPTPLGPPWYPSICTPIEPGLRRTSQICQAENTRRPKQLGQHRLDVRPHRIFFSLRMKEAAPVF